MRMGIMNLKGLISHAARGQRDDPPDGRQADPPRRLRHLDVCSHSSTNRGEYCLSKAD